jgi:hypothetical protein
MSNMRPLTLLCLLCLPPTLAAAQAPPPLTADAIMARVAANQDASEAGRSHFLYVQHVRIASRKGSKVRCEEITDSRVTPSVAGHDHRLLKLDGRMWQKGKYVTYTSLPVRPGASAVEADNDDLNLTINVEDDTMDRDLVENMRKNLTTGKSKDGISANLFPLTSKEQGDYAFTLLGHEPRNGRDCFHIAFHPKDRDDFGWKGEAWIDATAFQPVVIRTALSRKIPFAIRAFLGTDVPGLGFTIIYAPQPATQPNLSSGDTPSPVWFPTSFGTEFKLHVLYFLHRDIVFNAENRDFQVTHVTSEIVDTPGH